MENFEILFVDDDRTILELVEEYLTAFDYRVSVVDNGMKALELIRDKEFDVVFTDFKMPEMDGIELLAMIKEHRPETEVIIVTGHGTMESAVQAMKIGSYDYIQKPFKLDILKIIIDKIFEGKKIKDENVILKTRLKHRHKYDQLVGINLKMQEIYDQIDHMRRYSPNVLIQGESGTGKELAAQVIYKNSEKNQKALIPINCKSLGKEIPEDQLYDHAANLLKSSEASTIFLDEIAEITPIMQAEISRAYKDNNLNTTSDDANPGLGVRFLAVTNKNIEEGIQKGIYQQDFLNCVSDVVVQMPPLRERKEDICLLINHFLSKFNLKSENKVMNVSPEALDVLLDYNWPGNVIQLENVIERAFALKVDLTIELDDLPSEIRTFGEISKIS